MRPDPSLVLTLAEGLTEADRRTLALALVGNDPAAILGELVEEHRQQHLQQLKKRIGDDPHLLSEILQHVPNHRLFDYVLSCPDFVANGQHARLLIQLIMSKHPQQFVNFATKHVMVVNDILDGVRATDEDFLYDYVLSKEGLLLALLTHSGPSLAMTIRQKPELLASVASDTNMLHDIIECTPSLYLDMFETNTKLREQLLRDKSSVVLDAVVHNAQLQQQCVASRPAQSFVVALEQLRRVASIDGEHVLRQVLEQTNLTERAPTTTAVRRRR